jgi:hypothetical protein
MMSIYSRVYRIYPPEYSVHLDYTSIPVQQTSLVEHVPVGCD